MKNKVTLNKKKLFDKMKRAGLFWSYSKNIEYEDGQKDILLCETVLKYGDIEEIKKLFNLYDTQKLKKVWEKNLMADKSFKKTNYLLARYFFKMNIEANFFDEIKNERFEKLKLLAL